MASPATSAKSRIDRVTLDRGVSHIWLPNGQEIRVLWITLEGPIGAGKTELTKVFVPALEREYGADCVFYVAEPIDDLMASGLFQDYQRDPKTWAFEFQITCFDKRTDYFRAAWKAMEQKLMELHPTNTYRQKTVLLLSERSIMSDVCFMRVQHACGFVKEDSLQRYLAVNMKWRELYQGVRPGLVVYCRPGTQGDAVLDTCQARIRERNRDSEQELVTRAYNGKVLDAHDRVFGSGNVVFPAVFGQPEATVPVVCVDTTANYRDDAQVAQAKSAELLQHISDIFGSEHSPRNNMPALRSLTDAEKLEFRAIQSHPPVLDETPATVVVNLEDVD